MECQFCNGEMAPWVSMPIDAKKNMRTRHSALVRCRKCGTGVMAPMPEPVEISGFYDIPAYYTHGQSHIVERRGNIFDRALVKLAWMMDRATPFRVEAEAISGETVLDMGCGDGKLLERFRRAGCIVLGIDPDPKARAEAAKAGIRVLDGTAEEPPPALVGTTFDFVLITHALEHCIDPNKALRNASRFLAPGGRLYVEVPNCGCVHFETMTICSENFDSPRHLVFFTAAGLSAAIGRAGLTIEGWRYEGFTRHHLAGWRDWEVTIARRLAARNVTKGVKAHTWARSLSILATSAFAPDDRKYDAIGLLARKSGQPSIAS
jgi:SAM-dependent methyltransferase